MPLGFTRWQFVVNLVQRPFLRPEDDDALKIAMNSEESVERFSFAADGGMLLA